MPQLDSVKLELQLAVGTWVDISAYLDLSQGATIHIGRTSPFSAPSPGTAQLTLDNTDGRFTPGRQVLADGVTTNPYWPYLVPRAQIRWSWVKGASTYRRFTGYVKGWPTQQQSGHSRVPIQATTIDDRLARVQMDPMIGQEVLLDGPDFYWPLDDEAGSSSAAETVQNRAASIIHVSDAALTFGDNGPGAGNGPGVKFAPTGGGTTGQVLRRTNLPDAPTWATDFTVEVWVEVPSPAPADGGTVVALLSDDQFFGLRVLLDSSMVVWVQSVVGGVGFLNSPAALDPGWHLVTFVVNTLGNATLYVDGVSVDTAAMVGTEGVSPDQILIGGADYHATGAAAVSHDRLTGNIGHVALYDRALNATRVAAHFSAGRDWSGETVDERIARFLSYGGVAASGYNLDPSDVVLGGYPQGGKDVVSGSQDMAVSEGGGAVVYAGADGKVQFRNRDFRTPGAPDLTLDAQADLEGESYAGAFDDTLIVNEVAGSRGTVTGTASTFVVDDDDSQSAFGVISDSFTSYAADDDDVRYNAQDRLAAQRDPAFRLPQLTVDLSTSSTSTIYGDVAAVDIGSRIEVTGLPATVSPTSALDGYAEGWTESYDATSVKITFDLSPADNPPAAVYDDAEYGRYQADGHTLQNTVTASSATIRILSPFGAPTFTTDPAMYPLTIAIDTEHISLLAPPTGSTSPQIFTSVTRGVDGTTAAGHTANVAVDLAPATTYAL